MGTLRKYEMKTSLCKVFFETGTGLGHSLQHALDNGNFDNLYSTEIYKETANRAIIKFKKYKNVQILNTNSITALAATLPTIPPDVPILFFLDAHFPGEVEQGYDYATNDPSALVLLMRYFWSEFLASAVALSCEANKPMPSRFSSVILRKACK